MAKLLAMKPASMSSALQCDACIAPPPTRSWAEQKKCDMLCDLLQLAQAMAPVLPSSAGAGPFCGAPSLQDSSSPCCRLSSLTQRHMLSLSVREPQRSAVASPSS